MIAWAEISRSNGSRVQKTPVAASITSASDTSAMAGHGVQHLVGPDRVERGELLVGQDRDPHGSGVVPALGGAKA
jgi:hypothetical protein